MGCFTSSGVGRRKMKLTKKQTDTLNAKYFHLSRGLQYTYDHGNYERKIDMHLAKHRVRIFMMEAIENLLYVKYDGEIREMKMEPYKKKIIQNLALQQQDGIWREEQHVHALFNMIASHSPNKERVRDKIEKAEIYEPLEDEAESLYVDYIKNTSNILGKIIILCIERDILFHVKIAVEKRMMELYKTPRSDELEKIYLASLKYFLFEKRASLYKQVCQLYFRELPANHELRDYAREMILGSTLLFRPVIYNMLYDPMVDHHTIWWNFQELISPDRELQLIVEELGRFIDRMVVKCGPTLRIRERAANQICWTSKTSILANIDITAFIRDTPYLKDAADRINEIPPDVFEERKELFEEIIKTKCWEYMNAGYRFSTTAWTNATTYNSGNFM